MNGHKGKCVVVGLLVCLLFVSTGVNASEDGNIYKRARQAARQGDTDFAFMNYRQILRRFPGSRYRKEALFAKGEYYYALSDYEKAQLAFDEFLGSFPQEPGQIFVLAYLLKIAEHDESDERFKQLKKDIIDYQQVSLIFKDHKEFSYRSPLAHEFRAVFLIDKIEFYLGGELFAKLDF